MFGNTKRKISALEKEIDILKHKNSELEQIIKTQELIRLREQKAVFEEQSQLLSQVKFHLKDIHLVEEDSGASYVIVKYDQPVLKLYFDADGNIIRNNMFYSINKLQMMPMDDLKKIKFKLDEIKERRNK